MKFVTALWRECRIDTRCRRQRSNKTDRLYIERWIQDELDSPLVPWPGWTEFWARLPDLLGRGLSKFSYITVHMRDVLHWLHFSADTVSYHCNGLPLCPSLHPLLPLRPLLPSVGFGSASDAAFCCKGWALVPRALLGPFRLWVHQHGMISPLSCGLFW